MICQSWYAAAHQPGAAELPVRQDRL